MIKLAIVSSLSFAASAYQIPSQCQAVLADYQQARQNRQQAEDSRADFMSYEYNRLYNLADRAWELAPVTCQNNQVCWEEAKQAYDDRIQEINDLAKEYDDNVWDKRGLESEAFNNYISCLQTYPE